VPKRAKQSSFESKWRLQISQVDFTNTAGLTILHELDNRYSIISYCLTHRQCSGAPEHGGERKELN